MTEFAGTYKFKEDDGNFGKFLEKIGVGVVLRTAAKVQTPVVTIDVGADGTYSIVTETTFKKTEAKFKLGVEFEEERGDGKKVKSTVTKDGSKLVQVQKDDQQVVHLTREFTGDSMTLTCTAGDVTCVRKYIKQ